MSERYEILGRHKKSALIELVIELEQAKEDYKNLINDLSAQLVKRDENIMILKSQIVKEVCYMLPPVKEIVQELTTAENLKAENENLRERVRELDEQIYKFNTQDEIAKLKNTIVELSTKLVKE
jgi:hypothetical protein